MYQADEKRYEEMKYNRCGASGLLLPAVSLGLWHNFGSNGNFDNMLDMCHTAFDHGITHFDLANNYGPVYGAAEENFGRILKKDLGVYRDELVISTKAGYDMWPGPYGNWGSKKYLVASLDQSLKRMGLDYVDIFYHTDRIPIHRWRRPFVHWTALSDPVRHCMWEFPITIKNRPLQRQNCSRSWALRSLSTRENIPCL